MSTGNLLILREGVVPSSAIHFGIFRAIQISEQSSSKKSKNLKLGGIEMAIQKKSLISGKSAPKKATSIMPHVSENPGMTKLAHIRVAATKVAENRVAATRVANTK